MPIAPRSEPLLPQHDPNPKARAAALESARKTFGWNHSVYQGVALSSNVPKEDQPPKDWSEVMNHALGLVLANEARADRRSKLADWRVALGELAKVVSEVVHGDVQEAVNDAVAMLLAGDMESVDARSVEDFSVFFQTIPVPDLVHHLHDDVTFSRRFVAGADPEVLELTRAYDADFPVADEHIVTVSPGDTVAAALAEKRLFIADFGVLEGAPSNALGGAERWVFAPRAMLVVPKGTGTARIFAIQIGRKHGPETPIFTPRDGWGWELAKLHVAVADTVVGAIWHHHARTHLVAEPVIVAMRRQLAPNHPVRVLLEPHAVGTLYINKVGSTSVFAEHGLIDWIAGTGRAGVRDLARRSLESFRMDESIFPERLARRGLGSGSAIADFPWRDDGLLVWGALSEWVSSYLSLYYASDEEVLGDGELRGWLREIQSPDGGGLAGFGEGGVFRTRKCLAETITQIIFSVSALHSAMNFPVSVEMTVIPNSPFAIYRKPPSKKEGWTEADWRAALPPMEQSQRQFGTALLLGEARYGKLGEYPVPFEDARVAPYLDRFRRALSQVEEAIAARNQTRTPYIHMLPSRLAPSISI